MSHSAAAALNDCITTLCRDSRDPTTVQWSLSRIRVLVLTTYSHTPAEKRPLQDGISIKMCDGQQRIYRGRDSAFHCPYPYCTFKSQNSPAFRVRVSGGILAGRILTLGTLETREDLQTHCPRCVRKRRLLGIPNTCVRTLLLPPPQRRHGHGRRRQDTRQRPNPG